jgi:hypothetical protein
MTFGDPKPNYNSNIIDYGQYNNWRTPKSTTTKKTVTVKEYGPDGKLIKKTVTETVDTVTTESGGYPYTATWTSPSIDVKYAGSSIGATVKQQLDLMDREHPRR